MSPLDPPCAAGVTLAVGAGADAGPRSRTGACRDVPHTGVVTEPIRVVRAAELVLADPTPGMTRRQAFERPILWAGHVTTEPGATSGWHHHDTNESSLYVVSGVLRLECEGVEGHLDAVAGDFVHVPAFTVHRESNPGSTPSLAVIARAGGGIPTVNVEGPADRLG